MMSKMVHLYIATRGQKDLMENAIKHLETMYFPYQTDSQPEATGNKPRLLQCGVRPIELWEIACPKESLPVLLRTLQPATFEGENKLSNIRKVMDKVVWGLRKVMKLKPVPKYDPQGERGIIPNRGMIDIRGIGIKDDKIKEMELV